MNLIVTTLMMAPQAFQSLGIEDSHLIYDEVCLESTRGGYTLTRLRRMGAFDETDFAEGFFFEVDGPSESEAYESLVAVQRALLAKGAPASEVRKLLEAVRDSMSATIRLRDVA